VTIAFINFPSLRSDDAVGVRTDRLSSACCLPLNTHIVTSAGSELYATMPTYGIHDTTVKLYVWDPHQPAEQVGRTTPIDPACGRAGEPLKEEYFNGQEGVDFLGYDIPFFLVNAGRELFFETPQASSAITDVELVQGEEVQSHADESDDDAGSFLSTISSSMLADLSPQRFEESTTQNNAFGGSSLSTATLQLTCTCRNQEEATWMGHNQTQE
jgi:hypothetical protein